MPEKTGILLSELLKYPVFKGAKLIAGKSGLERLVKSVNVMEVPDILDWVKEGELLLTAVYAIRNDAAAQVRLIPELAKRRLAGLAIKPGRYIEKIPDFMVEQAEAHNLPLIELPLEASFSDIISPIISEIANKQAMLLKRADEAYSRLSGVVLEGGNLEKVAEVLSDILDGNLVIIETGMLGTVTSHNVTQVISLDKLKGKCSNRGTTEINGQTAGYVCVPILSDKNYYGVICVFATNKSMLDYEELIIERAANIAALVLTNYLAVTAVERRYYNELLNELLTEGISDEKQLIQRAATMGIKLNQAHIILTIYIENAREDKLGIIQQVVQGLRDAFRDFAVGCKSDNIIVFLPIAARNKAKSIEISTKDIYLLKKSITAKVKIICPSAQIFLGVGRPASGLAGIQKSYQEAVKALQLGRPIWPEEDIFFFDKLGVWRLLGTITDQDELRAFVNEKLGAIIAYDQEKSTELLKTLEIYFDCGGNLKKVAEKSFTHYNTVLYRLERITQLANINLNDSQTRLDIQIALKLHKILAM